MINVSIAPEVIKGDRKWKNVNKIHSRIKTDGEFNVNYHFALQVKGCVAAIEALQFLPSDASISVLIASGVPNVQGAISVYSRDALLAAQFAAASVGASATFAATLSKLNSALIEYTQALVWSD